MSVAPAAWLLQLMHPRGVPQRLPRPRSVVAVLTAYRVYIQVKSWKVSEDEAPLYGNYVYFSEVMNLKWR